MEIEELEREVVIIGSGAAGLVSAAIMTNHIDPEHIMVVSSHPPPYGGSTPLASLGLAASLHDDEGDTIELFQYDMVKLGADSDAAKLVAYYSRVLVLWLESLGLRWTRRLDGRISQRSVVGHSVPRIIRVGDSTGRAIVEVLTSRLLGLNVEFRPYLIAARMLVENPNRRVIVTLVDYLHEKIVVVEADTVVIASGGYAAIIPGSPSPNQYGVVCLTALLDAGFRLADIDEVVWWPVVLPEGEPDPVQLNLVSSKATPYQRIEKAQQVFLPIASLGGVLTDANYGLVKGKLYAVGEVAASKLGKAYSIPGMSLLEALASPLIAFKDYKPLGRSKANSKNNLKKAALNLLSELNSRGDLKPYEIIDTIRGALMELFIQNDGLHPTALHVLRAIYSKGLDTANAPLEDSLLSLSLAKFLSALIATKLARVKGSCTLGGYKAWRVGDRVLVSSQD